MSDITSLINYLNQTGGIPLVVTQTTTQNSYQFVLTTIIAGFGIFYFLYLVFEKIGLNVFAKMFIFFFRKQNKIRHLMVIKHTKNELFDISMINQTTARDIQKAMIKFNGEPFDLILYTGGGEIFSSEFISRLFRNYKGKVRTFVPVYSMSGGTYLALSTDEIYMNDYSCLGAIDPQLGMLFSYGSAKGWKEVMRIKKAKANDQSIIMNIMGKQYTKTIRKNINELLEGKMTDDQQRKALVDLLTSGDIQHALPLTKSMLKGYGLQIGNIDEISNKRMLKLINKMPEGVTYE